MSESTELHCLNDFGPSWREHLRPKGATAMFEGFEFRGPGWYRSPNGEDWMLVLPMKQEGIYWFYVWDGPKIPPIEMFAMIGNLPVHAEKGENK